MSENDWLCAVHDGQKPLATRVVVVPLRGPMEIDLEKEVATVKTTLYYVIMLLYNRQFYLINESFQEEALGSCHQEVGHGHPQASRKVVPCLGREVA